MDRLKPLKRYIKDTKDYRKKQGAEQCPLCGKGARLHKGERRGYRELIWVHGENDLGKEGSLVVDCCVIAVHPNGKDAKVSRTATRRIKGTTIEAAED